MQQCERREIVRVCEERKLEVGKRLVEKEPRRRHSAGGNELNVERHPSYLENEVVPSTGEKDQGEGSAQKRPRSVNYNERLESDMEQLGSCYSLVMKLYTTSKRRSWKWRNVGWKLRRKSVLLTAKKGSSIARRES